MLRLKSSLDWFVLTEHARQILSDIVSTSIREQFIEVQKDSPDIDRIEELRAKSHEALLLRRDPKNFTTKKRLLKIIEDYG